MKNKIAFFVLLALIQPVIAEEEKEFPFYVRLTQDYKYPGSDLHSTAGMIEQVVGQNFNTYTLSTPLGDTVQIPKTLVNRISDSEAAAELIEERKEHFRQLSQMFAYIEKLEQGQNSEQSQACTSNQGALNLSRTERRRMLYGIRQAGMITTINSGDSMSDEQIVELYNRAMEQQRLKGIENAVRNLNR